MPISCAAIPDIALSLPVKTLTLPAIDTADGTEACHRNQGVVSPCASISTARAKKRTASRMSTAPAGSSSSRPRWCSSRPSRSTMFARCCFRASASLTTRAPARGGQPQLQLPDDRGPTVFVDESINVNPFMSSGAPGTMIDDFGGDNFDHSNLGFIGGQDVGSIMTSARPIEFHPTPPGTAKRIQPGQAYDPCHRSDDADPRESPVVRYVPVRSVAATVVRR